MTPEQQHEIEIICRAEIEAERAIRIASLQARNEDLAEALMQRMIAQGTEQNAQKWN